MITYAHAEFIEQAIESVLMQRTQFPIELVIGEDSGPDQTLDICAHYQRLFPDMVRVLPKAPNMGSQANFIRTLYQCKGQYIALLEGDDYWTDPYKLQKQIEQLERDANMVFNFHNVFIVENNREVGKVYPGDRKALIQARDVFNHDYYQTCSIVFRSAPLHAISEAKAHEWVYNDITLFALLLTSNEQAKGYYLPETMAAYRVHPGGAWSMAGARKKYRISQPAEAIILDKYFKDPRFRRQIARREHEYYQVFMIDAGRHRDPGLMVEAIGKYIYWSFRTNPLSIWKVGLPFAYLLRACLRGKSVRQPVRISYKHEKKEQ